MTRRRLRTSLAAVSASAVLLVTGCGTSSSTSSNASNASAQPTQQQAGGGPGGMNLTTLATKLGVSQSTLQAAMQAARPTSGQRPSTATMAATLAKKLGLTTAKVEAALKATMPSGTPPQGAGAPRSGSAPTAQTS